MRRPSAERSGWTTRLVIGIVATAVLAGAADGRAAPVMPKDVNPTPTGTGASSPIVVGNTLYFIGSDWEHGGELWKSDGTAAGTTMVADLVPGPDGAIWQLFDVGGTIFILAGDWNVPLELWRSDGTPEGTIHLTTLHPGYEGYDAPGEFTAVGSVLYFGGAALPTAGLLCSTVKRVGTAAAVPETAIVNAVGRLRIASGASDELCLPAVLDF